MKYQVLKYSVHFYLLKLTAIEETSTIIAEGKLMFSRQKSPPFTKHYRDVLVFFVYRQSWTSCAYHISCQI